jgi:hypothetical protein
MLTVVWNQSDSMFWNRGWRGANSIHNIIQIISWSQSQIGGRRPGERGRASCGCILIMLDQTPRKCQRITLVSIEWNRHLILLFVRFGTLGLFPFWISQRKADGISRWDSIWTSDSHSGYFGGNPAGDLEHSFSRMDGAIATMCAGRSWVRQMSQKSAIHWNWF